MLIFLVESDSTYRDLSKNDFFEILVIFLDCANILDHFSDKSLILGNRLLISYLFRWFSDFKKIPTGPNK